MAKMLFNLTVEDTEVFAALLRSPSLKLTIGVPEPVQRKPVNHGTPAPLMLPAPSKKKKRNAGRIILAAMAEAPKAVHGIDELGKLCEAVGSTKGAAGVSISKLLKSGYVERVGVGKYKILREGIKRAGENGEDVKHKGKNNRQVIWSLFEKGEPLSVSDITAKFKKDNREPKSVSPQISNLKKEGLITEVGPSTYQITQKGKSNGTNS